MNYYHMFITVLDNQSRIERTGDVFTCNRIVTGNLRFFQLIENSIIFFLDKILHFLKGLIGKFNWDSYNSILSLTISPHSSLCLVSMCHSIVEVIPFLSKQEVLNNFAMFNINRNGIEIGSKVVYNWVNWTVTGRLFILPARQGLQYSAVHYIIIGGGLQLV